MQQNDHSKLRQFVPEMIDLFNDALGPNSYSQQIAQEYNVGMRNINHSPSYRSIDNMAAVLRAALTRFKRNPAILDSKKNKDSLVHRENVFLIHGQDEAKWRELKDILRSDFGVNAIVLMEKPDAGCKTIIEKFEYYAQTCSYAVAVFTPDDEVKSGEKAYLQARPNVIYELGWFCGRIGRHGAMLLLKEGTSVFSDFGGVIQKRFKENISEQIMEMRKELVAAGIIDET